MPLDDEESRIRAVFCLGRSSPIPRVTYETLLRYREFFREKLVIPFDALWAETTPPVKQLFRYVRVLALSDEIPYMNNGLLGHIRDGKSIAAIPLAELGVREDCANHDLIEDYAYWFWNWR